MTNTPPPAGDTVREMLVAAVENTPRRTRLNGRGPRRFTMAGAVALTVAGALAGGTLSAAAITLVSPAAEPPTVPPGQYQELNIAYIKAFDRAPQPADTLPSDLPDYAIADLKSDTSRLIGEHDGATIYLVEGASAQSPVCAVVWGTPQTWIVGCGGLPLGVGGQGIPDVKVAPMGEPLSETETRLDDNVIVTD